MASQDAGEGGEVLLRFLTTTLNAGAIIGKGGATIKGFRSKYSAVVNIPDCSGHERILSITALKDNAVKILMETLPTWEEHKHMNHEDGEMEVTMLVHASQVGAIIGKAGTQVKDIRKKTGCGIRVHTDSLPNSNERPVVITGKKEGLKECLLLIVDILQSTPVRGATQLYEPGYNDYYGGGGPQYGGGGGGGGYGGYGGYDAPPQQRGGGRGGRGRGRGGYGDRGGYERGGYEQGGYGGGGGGYGGGGYDQGYGGGGGGYGGGGGGYNY